MNEALLQRFIALISTKTGLHVREQDKENLAKKIWGRVKSLKLSKPDEYYQVLVAGDRESYLIGETTGDREWKELSGLLTTGESYFFRDKGQFTLLKNRILPELIETKKKQVHLKSGQKPSLRLWSAGCSTGEEPYSLAILLSEMLMDWQDWDILILGTDINQKAIEKAKQGIYSSWSFRLVDTQLQPRYFHQRETEWKLDERIGRMVTFSYGNLVQDNYPDLNSEIHNIDLIICRNVFVYFESQAISLVLNKFYHTLLPGGYLIAGHTELYGQDLGEFQVKALPESIAYQRSSDMKLENYYSASFDVNLQETSSTNYNRYIARQFNSKEDFDKARSTAAPVTPPPQVELEKSAILPIKFKVTKFGAGATVKLSDRPGNLTDLKPDIFSKKPESNDYLKQAENLLEKKYYREAIEQAKRAIDLHPDSFNAYYLLAKTHANLGERNQAIYYCQQAIELDYMSVLPYYLLAHIAEEKGDSEKAKLFFKRIIYLAPSSISAYLELGLIYQRERNTARARKTLSTAVELLKNLSPSTTIDQHGLPAGELLGYVMNLVKDCEKIYP